MLGGDQSFGLGGYYKTALEEILPVRSDFEKEKEKPSLAMILVIDKSGSMGGEKIELAKEAAKSAIELLGPNDKVGVIAFEGDVFWVSEVHPCTDKGFVLDRVSTHRGRRRDRHVPGDGGGLRGPDQDRRQAQARHHPDRRDLGPRRLRGDHPADGPGADHRLDRRRSARGATSSCSRRSPGSATAGATSPTTRRSVPQIFAKETVSASKSAINEQPFTPAGRPDDQGAGRARRRRRPAPAGLRRDPAQADQRADPGHRERRPAADLVAVRPGDERGVHLRRQVPMGRRVDRLAELRQVLGAGRPPRDAQERGQGRRRPGRPEGPHGRRSRSTRSTRPAGSSTTPRPR